MCAFLIVKWQENNRKIKENWGMVLTQVGDDTGDHFQAPAHISKYGNCWYSKSNIAIKYQKNWEVLLTVGNSLGEQFQGPKCSSKYGYLSKNSQTSFW